jgi:hypothetical protein
VSDTVQAIESGQPPSQLPWQAWRTLPGRTQEWLLHQVFAQHVTLQHALANETADPLAAAVVWEPVLDLLRSALWPVPLVKEQIAFYEAMQEQRWTRSVEHTLLIFTPEDANAAAMSVVAQLSQALSRNVTLRDTLPSVLPGEYEVDEWHARLRPLRDDRPWLSVVHSYDARGRIDARLLHPLLDGLVDGQRDSRFDVTLAIDVQTLSRHRAMRAAEQAYTIARVVQRDSSVKDVGAERKFADSERVMHALHDQEALHEVQIAALVSGESPEVLERNLAVFMGQTGSALRFTRVAGAQKAWLPLFSTTPTRAIDAPFTRRNYLSSGLGCLLGVLGYHRASGSDGLLWGVDDIRSSPIFFNPFGDTNSEAAHIVVLGKTGFGKTFFLNVMTLRAAALEGYRVIWIDAFENGYRVERAIGAGARCYSIGIDSVINLCDVVFTPHRGADVVKQPG